MRIPLLAVGACLLAVAAGAGPQTGEAVPNRYESQYGEPVDVDLDELIQRPESYISRAVRTTGTLQMSIHSLRQLTLRAKFGGEAWIFPMPDVETEWEQESRNWLSKEVQVTGVVSQRSTEQAGQVVSIQFWAFLGPPEEIRGPIKANDLSLEALLGSPGKYDGKTVRVVGKFRGRNLYGDLPTKSQRSTSDWVIKNDLYAVWITGRKPRGQGWELDSSLKRDTGKWIEVVGRPETAAGFIYLRAIQIALTNAPTPTADAQPPPPPPEKPKVPPVVVFALPLDGDREIPADAKFQVQFSKDMDEASFRGRVFLRYAGPRLPGDRAFDAVRLSYDGGRRALMVDPGDVLRPGRVVELILLPGIVDIDGLALEARPGKMPGEAADLLRYRVVAGLLSNP